ncbi:MAG: DNA polymerase III subunit gamma/tau [Nitrospinota bacterium]
MEKTTESTGHYQVLARKWRPSHFSEVVGQRHIVQSLQNAITMNRVAGAYLFSGMRGVGKTSMARILALSANCENGPTVTPCLTCVNCREIINGSSVDVLEIDAASNTGVDDVRELRDHLSYAPAKCRKKIYIIDEVHMLSKSAFNAFLKSLEEPPPNTIFILATTEQNKVPDTILSRCQCFEFRALSEEQISKKLAAIAESEKMDIAPGAIRMIARRAEGSMRDAQSLMDQAVAYAGETVDEEKLGIVLGLVSREKVWQLLEALIERETGGALNGLHDLYYAGYDVTVLVRELSESVRTLLITKVSSDPEKVLNETAESIAKASKIVENVSAGRLQLFFDILLRTEQQCKFASNALSVLEVAVIKMIRLDDVVQVDEILGRLKTFPSAASGEQPSALPIAREEAPPYNAGRADEGTVKSDSAWSRVKSNIPDKRAFLKEALEKVDLILDGDKAILLYPPAIENFIRDQINKNNELIKSSIEKELDKALKLELRPVAVAEDEVSEKKKKNEEDNGREKLNNPIVQKAAEMFEGRPSIENENG